MEIKVFRKDKMPRKSSFRKYRVCGKRSLPRVVREALSVRNGVRVCQSEDTRGMRGGPAGASHGKVRKMTGDSGPHG